MASSATIGGLELTRYVQASFKIKTSSHTVFIDPHRITDTETGGDKADLLLITHPHPDHLDSNAIDVVLKDSTIIVASEAAAQALEGKGTVIPLKEGGTTEQAGIKIKAVAGYNQIHPRDQSFNVGFVFEVEGQQVYHAGDTGSIPEMANMGSIDIAMLPIGGTYTMDEEEAANAIKDMIKPKVAIPMHYGYATAGDPEKFKSLIGSAATVQILEPVLKISMGG